MMGIQEAPARLFYDFDLEAHVPGNHILREIDRFLDVGTTASAACFALSPSGTPFDCPGTDHKDARCRSAFEATVARCISEGRAGGHGFAVDASLIEADVDRMNPTAQADWDVSAIDPDDAPRAVSQRLSGHCCAIPCR